MENSNIQLR